ncbi:13665_t:CDS:2, partial [Funneliformis mosseae]
KLKKETTTARTVAAEPQELLVVERDRHACFIVDLLEVIECKLPLKFDH